LNKVEAKEFMRKPNSFFESKVEIPRIKHGNRQELETLLNEEALLLAFIKTTSIHFIYVNVHLFKNVTSQYKRVIMPRKVQIRTYAIPKGYVSPTKVKKEFTTSIELLEKALITMGFYESKKTTTSKHYRRSDGLHIVLIKRRKRKMSEALWNDEHAKITILKVHKDSEKHKDMKFDHRNFFKELNKAIADCAME